MNEQNRVIKKISTPVPDPCLPKGYMSVSNVEEISVDFTGESNFQKCLEGIFPVLLKSSASENMGNCKQFSDEIQASSCLLKDSIPAFDFEVNHFVGVSGYWEAISNLLSYENINDIREDVDDAEENTNKDSKSDLNNKDGKNSEDKNSEDDKIGEVENDEDKDDDDNKINEDGKSKEDDKNLSLIHI